MATDTAATKSNVEYHFQLKWQSLPLYFNLKSNKFRGIFKNAFDMIVYLNLPYDYYMSLSLLRQHYF